MSLGASFDRIPCVARAYILYAPLSLRTTAASTNDWTSSMRSSTMMAIFPATSPTTFIGGFSLAVRGGRVEPTVVTRLKEGRGKGFKKILAYQKVS